MAGFLARLTSGEADLFRFSEAFIGPDNFDAPNATKFAIVLAGPASKNYDPAQIGASRKLMIDMLGYMAHVTRLRAAHVAKSRRPARSSAAVISRLCV